MLLKSQILPLLLDFTAFQLFWLLHSPLCWETSNCVVKLAELAANWWSLPCQPHTHKIYRTQQELFCPYGTGASDLVLCRELSIDILERKLTKFNRFLFKGLKEMQFFLFTNATLRLSILNLPNAMCLDCDVPHPSCHALGTASEGSPAGQTPRWISPCTRTHTWTRNGCPEKSKNRVSAYDGSPNHLHRILQAWYGVFSWETSKEPLSKYLCGLLLDLGKPFASMCPLAGCSADVKESLCYFEFCSCYLHLIVKGL